MEITAAFSQEELSEGWAEVGRTPRVITAVKLGAKTDLGRLRENNEDKFEFFEPEDPAVLATKGAFYAVADGMGGHLAGQIACEMTLKTVIRTYYDNPSSDTGASLRRAIQEANSIVFDTAQAIPDRQGMGTTLTAAILCEDMLTLAQVGDSRGYLIRDGQIRQLTEDHSWVAEQVKLGAMSLDEAQASPFRNIITRSIGTAPTVEVDIFTLTLQVSDILILCSDGLSGHLEPAEIQKIVESNSPSVAALRLIDEANGRGGRDNITTLVLAVRAIVPYGAESSPAAIAEPEIVPEAKAEKRGWGLRR